MNLTHHRINSKCVLARFTESEIVDVLTRAVAAEAGIDLNDPAVEVRTRDLARALPSAAHTFEAVIDINIDMSEPESSTAASEADAVATLDYLKGAICKPILADDLITGIKINGVHEVPWKTASNGYAYMDFGSLDISAVSDRREMFVDHQNIPPPSVRWRRWMMAGRSGRYLRMAPCGWATPRTFLMAPFAMKASTRSPSARSDGCPRPASSLSDGQQPEHRPRGRGHPLPDRRPWLALPGQPREADHRRALPG